VSILFVMSEPTSIEHQIAGMTSSLPRMISPFVGKTKTVSPLL
jgi:hypothetical protein